MFFVSNVNDVFYPLNTISCVGWLMADTICCVPTIIMHDGFSREKLFGNFIFYAIDVVVFCLNGFLGGKKI